jgi:nucleotide-binding universal stress UspA family protein
LAPDGLELGRLLQELLDLDELLERLVGTGHVGEGGLRGVLADQLGLALAELHDAVAAALHLVHEEEQQAEQQQDRQEADEQLAEQARVVDLHVVADVGARSASVICTAWSWTNDARTFCSPVDGRALLEGQPDLLLVGQHLDLVGLLVGADHVAGLDGRQHLRGVDLGVLARRRGRPRRRTARPAGRA